MLPPILPLIDPKSVLRERQKALRREIAAARPDAGVQAAKNFLDAIPFRADAAIALYHPIREELDTAPLAAALAERGLALALPVVVRRGAPLSFRLWSPHSALARGRYGASVPPEDAGETFPDVVVAPLLAFTRAGARLGYGGGYYDRTLAALRATRPVLAVGYGYAAQQVDALPVSRLDEPLDWIVTEREAFATRRAAGADRE